MAEAREVAPHKLKDTEVRQRFNRAVEDYRKKYPGYKIEPTWRTPTKCEVKLKLSPMLALNAVVTLSPGYLVFVVSYPDAFRFYKSEIGEYVVAFRNEVQKYLGPAAP
jgi:hypothetical protein